MKFTEKLFVEAEDIWNGYLEHPFIKGIGDGSLDKDKFKNYLVQDYLYLKDYAKVFAMGLVKSDNMKEMKLYYSSIHGILEDETAVHIEYLKNFGLSIDEIEKYPINLTTASYTSYMLSIALKGNIKEIAMTIMPCTWSYYFIGINLLKNNVSTINDNFYRAWIEEYSSEEFKEFTQLWMDYINEICINMSIEEEQKLIEIFRKASQYEMEVWNMAYK